jgi:phosphate transport system permease protein
VRIPYRGPRASDLPYLDLSGLFRLARRYRQAVGIWWERQSLAGLNRHGFAALATGASTLTMILGGVSLSTNSLDGLPLPVLGLLALSLILFLLRWYRQEREVNLAILAMLGASVVAASVLGGLPEYFSIPGLHAIFHRSIAATLVLIPLGLASTSTCLYFLLGATPRAEDVARYPLVGVPAALALGMYIWLMYGLAVKSIPQFELDLIIQPFLNQTIPTKTIGPNGEVADSITFVVQAGFRNQLIGTLILVVLTTVIALPIGVGTGIYVSEYARGGLAQVVRFSTTALRGISVFTLGLTAVSLVTYARDTPFALAFTGYYLDASGVVRPDGGSFLPAALVISMLVIPVIARATEEGCRSLPPGLREGSVALGASESYTLVQIILPWAVPNIVTAVLLGCAEAAGTLAPILFIAGTGENGVGLFSRVTSLSWGIFAAVYSTEKPFRDQMIPHQFAGAILLLLIALGLSTAALVVKTKFGERYRGR